MAPQEIPPLEDLPHGVHHLPPARPESPLTQGIRLNHLMIRITNPEASLKFYCDVLGMHVIFAMNTGGWHIYYLGPRDVQISSLGTAKGLLELYYIPGGPESYRNGNEKGGVEGGFGHLGFTVPDVAEVIRRCKEGGYKILKDLGEEEQHQLGVPDVVKAEDVAEGYRYVFRQLAFVEDPDGYWVEFVPQVVKQPPSA